MSQPLYNKFMELLLIPKCIQKSYVCFKVFIFLLSIPLVSWRYIRKSGCLFKRWILNIMYTCIIDGSCKVSSGTWKEIII